MSHRRPSAPPRAFARRALALAAASCLAAALPARAVDVVWLGGTGSWSSGSGWSSGVPVNGSGFDVFIDGGNLLPSFVTLSSSASIGRLSIDALDALQINGSATLTLYGGSVVNHGSLILAGSGSGYANLTLAANTTLSGSGTTLLSAHATGYYGQIQAGSSTLTIANGHTVSGAGLISGAVVNRGTVVADGSSALTLSSGSGRTFDNSAGLIEITDGSTLNLATGGTLSGGTIRSLGEGRLTGTNSASSLFRDLTLSGNFSYSGVGIFSGVTISDRLTVAGNSTFGVAGTLVNNGVLDVTPGNSGYSTMSLSADTTLSGSGTTLLSRNNSGYYGQIAANSYTLTIGGAQTVRGAGMISGSIVNQGTVVADGSTPLILSSGSGKVFDNSAGLIEISDGSTLNLSGNSSLVGGTIRSLGAGNLTGTNAASSVLRDLTLSGVITFSGVASTRGVTISDRLTIAGNSTFGVAGTLVNNGVLDLASGNSGYSTMSLSADTTLSGSGTTLLSRNNSGYYGQIAASSYTLTIGGTQTVRGAGLISGSIVNQGTVVADGSTPLILSSGSGRVFDNSAGLIEVTDGSTLNLSANSTLAGGVVRSLGHATLTGTNASSTSFLNLSLAGDFSYSGVGVFSGVTIADRLTVNNGNLLSTGLLTNNGQLNLAGSGSGNATLQLYADTTLAGSGTTTLSIHSTGYAGQIQASSSTLTIAGGHTVEGSGTIGGAVVNKGTVVANGGSALTLSSGSGKTFDNSAGLIRIADGSTLALSSNSTVKGGTVHGDGVARISGVNSTSVLRDVTLTGSVWVANSGALYTAGTLTNDGLLTLAGSGSGNAILYLAADTTLAGSGTTLLSTHSTGYNGQILANGSTLTIAGGHTVSGTGLLGGAVVNQGTVIASGGTLTLNPGAGRTFDNSAGLVRVADGATLLLASSSTLSGGTLAGEGGARLSSVTSTSVLKDATLSGSFAITGGGTLYASGTLTNNGLLNLAGSNSGNSALHLAADTTLGGNGTTVLGTHSTGYSGQIQGNGSTLTIASGHTVSGAGLIAGAVVNRGTVVASGGTLTLSSGSGRSFDNAAGQLRVADGASLVLASGSTLSGGTLAGEGSARLSSASSSSVLKDATLAGSFSIAAGGMLYASGTLTNNGLLSLAGSSSGNSTLNLAADTTLAGNGTTLLGAHSTGYSGTINTSGRTLTIAAAHTLTGSGLLSGSTLNHGTLAPGEGVGRLNVSGTLSLADDARLLIDVAGLTQATQYDLLAVSGNVNLGGAVLFDFGSFEAQVGDSFTFLTFSGSSSGSFTLAQASGYELSLSYGAHAVTATITGITPVPEPGTWALMAAGLLGLGLRARRRA